MIKNQYYLKYQFIWLVSKDKSEKISTELKNKPNTNVQLIHGKWHKLITFKALYFVMTAKTVFYTHGSPVRNHEKNSNQLVINLWHGCGYKQKEEVKLTYNKKPYADYYIVPGKLFVEPKSKYWNCSPAKILPLGYPRYDLFTSESIKGKKFIEKIKDDQNNKIIFWMPTFRKSENNERYPEGQLPNGFDLPLMRTIKQLETLDEYCENHNIKICIKVHPFQLEYTSSSQKYNNIIFLTTSDLDKAGVQLYEILQYTDALITDYSSVAIDYLLINKPIAFILDDYTEYNHVRGFTFADPLKYMPGHHIYNDAEFLEFVYSIYREKDPFLENRKIVKLAAHNVSTSYSGNLLQQLGITI